MPAAVPVIAAGVTGLAALGGSKISANASGRSARIQSDAANEAARIGGLTADKQLAFQREEAARLAADAELARSGNYAQWRAGMQNDRGENIAGLRNSYNQSGDMAFNNRASDVSRGRTDVGMFNTSAYNNRASDLAAGHNAYATYADRQRRLGALGEMLGQGPRQVTAYEDPAALREAQYFEPDPLKRTDLELPPELILPEYVQGNVKR
jgi:hypothetical protein